MSNPALAEIGKEHQLKHVETTDKSAPKIESDVHIKTVDREGFLNEIQKDHQLKHTETTDKSAPKIEGEVNLKKIDRGALLADIKKHDS